MSSDQYRSEPVGVGPLTRGARFALPLSRSWFTGLTQPGSEKVATSSFGKRMLTMLRYQRILLCLALVSVVVWLSGCLIMAGGTKVVNPGATRQKVNFEFEEGQPIFRREFNRRYESGAATVGSDGFAIPFIIAADETKMLFENAFFNVQVDAADVNGDGLISDAEARVYANVQKK